MTSIQSKSSKHTKTENHTAKIFRKKTIKKDVYEKLVLSKPCVCTLQVSFASGSENWNKTCYEWKVTAATTAKHFLCARHWLVYGVQDENDTVIYSENS